MEERRRSVRRPVEIRAHLRLAGGRDAPVVIKNLGELGALVALPDLEVEVLEGERAVLEYAPPGSAANAKPLKTTGMVVRVELDMDTHAVMRQIAVHFDGGPAPA